MKFREVASSKAALRLPELSFGAASLGNLYHAIADDDARHILTTAARQGISYIDTAPHYGHGLSERRVGDFVRGHDQILVSTKVGRLLKANASLPKGEIREGFASDLPFERSFDYSYDGVMRSLEDSQQRLGLASIDILYVHDIGPLTHGSRHDIYFTQLTKGGGLRALEELRTSGVIKAFGVGANEWQICQQVMDHAHLDLILLAGRYSLLEHSPLDEFFPLCAARGTSVVIGGVYNSGILATGTAHDGPIHYDYAPAPPHIIDRVRHLEAICADHQIPLPAAALAFALAHPQVVSVLVGLSSTAQVEHSMRLYHQSIPDDLWADMKQAGLLPENAPTPHGTAPNPILADEPQAGG